MEINLKKIGKIAGAACAATAVVAVSSLVASGAAVGAIAEGFKSAGNTVKNILSSLKQDEAPAEDAVAETVEENQ